MMDYTEINPLLEIKAAGDNVLYGTAQRILLVLVRNTHAVCRKVKLPVVLDTGLKRNLFFICKAFCLAIFGPILPQQIDIIVILFLIVKCGLYAEINPPMGTKAAGDNVLYGTVQRIPLVLVRNTHDVCRKVKLPVVLDPELKSNFLF